MSQLELPDLLTCSCDVSEPKQSDSVDLLVETTTNQSNQTQVSKLEDTPAFYGDTGTTLWTNISIVVSAFLLYKLIRNWR